MFGAIASWAEDKATGLLKTGIQAGGSLAGNAVGGVGSLVESAGKSAASGVQGGIGGVASYINGYGDTVKRSMSADGPVSSAQKKTAVKASPPTGKPPSAAKALPPSTLPPKKALPSTVGSQKSLPAPRAPPIKPDATGKSALGRKPPVNNKPGGPTSVKSAGPVGVSKPNAKSSRPASNQPKLVSNVNANGKVSVSAESRPGYRKSAVARNTKSMPAATGGDILGIGNNFGDISKTKTGGPQNKTSSARKPSAADPLALGDLGNVGKKK